MKHYQITKRFTAGVLRGMTITVNSAVRFDVGRTYQECFGAGAYLVLACEDVAE
jgi:hypothetical protein